VIALAANRPEDGTLASDGDAGRERESRRILDRVGREADSSGFAQQATPQAADRQSDPIEYWGTRIGRMLGLAIAIVLMITLAFYIVRSL
jgi:hypothetical protein